MIRNTKTAIIPADKNFCWYILEESEFSVKRKRGGLT